MNRFTALGIFEYNVDDFLRTIVWLHYYYVAFRKIYQKQSQGWRKPHETHYDLWRQAPHRWGSWGTRPSPRQRRPGNVARRPARCASNAWWAPGTWSGTPGSPERGTSAWLMPWWQPLTRTPRQTGVTWERKGQRADRCWNTMLSQLALQTLMSINKSYSIFNPEILTLQFTKCRTLKGIVHRQMKSVALIYRQTSFVQWKDKLTPWSPFSFTASFSIQWKSMVTEAVIMLYISFCVSTKVIQWATWGVYLMTYLLLIV